MIEINNNGEINKNKTIKRQNIILEFDENVGAAYIYMPPYSNKNSPSIKHTKEYLQEGKLPVLFDYDKDNKLAGIEILSARELFN